MYVMLLVYETFLDGHAVELSINLSGLGFTLTSPFDPFATENLTASIPMDLRIEGRTLHRYAPQDPDGDSRKLVKRAGYLVDEETGAIVNNDKQTVREEEPKTIVPRPYHGHPHPHP